MSILILFLVCFVYCWLVAIVGSALSAPRWVEWAAILLGCFIIGSVL